MRGWNFTLGTDAPFFFELSQILNRDRLDAWRALEVDNKDRYIGSRYSHRNETVGKA